MSIKAMHDLSSFRVYTLTSFLVSDAILAMCCVRRMKSNVKPFGNREPGDSEHAKM
jgi:hypothetical protein